MTVLLGVTQFDMLLTLCKNGGGFYILLSAFKLALLASFLSKLSKEYLTTNEASRAILNGDKRILKSPPFLDRVYDRLELLKAPAFFLLL